MAPRWQASSLEQPGPDGFSQGGAGSPADLDSAELAARLRPAHPRRRRRRGAERRPTWPALARAVVRAAEHGCARHQHLRGDLRARRQTHRPDRTRCGAALRGGREGRGGSSWPRATPRAGSPPDRRAAPIRLRGARNDPRNWGGVSSVSTPSWWQPYVLSVGSLNATGQPSGFTMAARGSASPRRERTSRR